VKKVEFEILIIIFFIKLMKLKGYICDDFS